MTAIFISYSHLDSKYAQRLAAALTQNGFDIWIDDRVELGESWPEVLQRHLDESSAVVLIMTPRSEASEWVRNEVLRAKRKEKTIFPLLLEGDPWLLLESAQYVDVKDGELPTPSFYDSLAAGSASAARRVRANVRPVVRSSGSLGPVVRRTVVAIGLTAVSAVGILLLYEAFTTHSSRNEQPRADPSSPPSHESVATSGPAQHPMPSGSSAGPRAVGSTILFQELEKRLQQSDFAKEGTHGSSHPR